MARVVVFVIDPATDRHPSLKPNSARPPYSALLVIVRPPGHAEGPGIRDNHWRDPTGAQQIEPAGRMIKGFGSELGRSRAGEVPYDNGLHPLPGFDLNSRRAGVPP